MKVLIAVDGSPDGFEAARHAGRLLSPLRTSDRAVLHAAPSTRPAPRPRYSSAPGRPWPTRCSTKPARICPPSCTRAW